MKFKLTACDFCLLLLTALIISCQPAPAAEVSAADLKRLDTVDLKYCGPPARDKDGRIIRSKRVKAAFRELVACPSTGLFTGPCPDWSIDHPWPLEKCGCDSVTNMQWLKNSIKSCAGTECKDRWERKVYQCKE